MLAFHDSFPPDGIIVECRPRVELALQQVRRGVVGRTLYRRAKGEQESENNGEDKGSKRTLAHPPLELGSGRAADASQDGSFDELGAHGISLT